MGDTLQTIARPPGASTSVVPGTTDNGAGGQTESVRTGGEGILWITSGPTLTVLTYTELTTGVIAAVTVAARPQFSFTPILNLTIAIGVIGSASDKFTLSRGTAGRGIGQVTDFSAGATIGIVS